MVGVGPNGTRSVLARVSIVDSEGKVILDKSLDLLDQHFSAGCTPPKMNECSLEKDRLKRKVILQSSNHHFSGDMLVFFLGGGRCGSKMQSGPKWVDSVPQV